MISPIQIKTTNYNYINYRQSPQSFRGGCPVSIAKSSEKCSRKFELGVRKLANRAMDLFNRNTNDELYNKFLSVDKNSPEYIDILRQISRQHLGKKDLEVNFENDRIRNLARSNTPHIYIMNHDSQSKDPQMLAAFNTLLNDEYMDLGLAKTCPRPRIVLNEDILLAMNERNRKIFEQMGSVGIDASLHNSDSSANSKKFITLIRDFIKGKANIFIFPEGKNSVSKTKSLAEKFQLRVAEMVAKLAGRLPEIRVTPLGFAYGKKAQVDSIHIGETVVFKKDGDNITASIGNITSDFARPEYKKFFKNRQEATLTENNIPVKGKEQAQYIGGVLCENLRICKEEAKKAITDSI